MLFNYGGGPTQGGVFPIRQKHCSPEKQLLSALDVFAFGSGGVGSAASAVDVLASQIYSGALESVALPAFRTNLACNPMPLTAVETSSGGGDHAICGCGSQASVDEDAELLKALAEIGSCEGPPHWCEQLEAIMGVGARGTVEQFHTFLLALAQDTSRKQEHSRFVALCAVVLSSQTRDATTLAAVERLARRLGCEVDGNNLPSIDPAAVVAASPEVLEECLLGVNFHKTKARHLKALADALLQRHSGIVPHTFADLVALPGVGPKVANVVRSVVFGEVKDCGMVVDTHVHRVARRLGWTSDEVLDPEHTRRKLEIFIAEEFRELVARRIIGFGQEVCLPRRPRCGSCPVAAIGICPTAQVTSNAPPKSVPAAAATSTFHFTRPLVGGAGRGAKRLIELE